MATLEELRRWAQGERVEGMPSHKPKQQPVEPPVITGDRISKKFKISADGKDALILFGKLFPGKRVSEIVTTPRGRKYLLWIVGEDFSDALKAVCRYHMELHKRAK